MRSWQVHYMNKYPGGQVRASDSSVDVYCAEGKHRVALRKDGAGGWSDQSAEQGCEDRHDLAPIPKAARVHKLQKDGNIGLDEKHEERKEARKSILKDGKIPSEKELGLV